MVIKNLSRVDIHINDLVIPAGNNDSIKIDKTLDIHSNVGSLHMTTNDYMNWLISCYGNLVIMQEPMNDLNNYDLVFKVLSKS